MVPFLLNSNLHIMLQMRVVYLTISISVICRQIIRIALELSNSFFFKAIETKHNPNIRWGLKFNLHCWMWHWIKGTIVYYFTLNEIQNLTQETQFNTVWENIERFDRTEFQALNIISWFVWFMAHFSNHKCSDRISVLAGCNDKSTSQIQISLTFHLLSRIADHLKNTPN